MTAFAQDYDVVAIDMRGYNTSDKPQVCTPAPLTVTPVTQKWARCIGARNALAACRMCSRGTVNSNVRVAGKMQELKRRVHGSATL